jgi:hypothetical protein
MRPNEIPTPRPMEILVTWGLEVLESGIEGGVDVGDIWPEFFMLGGVDGAAPDVDDEVDDGLLDIDGATVGWVVDVEPAIPPRMTLPTGIVKVEAPAVQQSSPQQ